MLKEAANPRRAIVHLPIRSLILSRSFHIATTPFRRKENYTQIWAMGDIVQLEAIVRGVVPFKVPLLDLTNKRIF